MGPVGYAKYPGMKLVATGTWFYAGVKPMKILVFSVPAEFAPSRYNSSDEVDEARPIPQTLDGLIYITSHGGQADTLEGIMKWADSQPWGPVKWELKVL
jgi:hypothetical protein